MRRGYQLAKWLRRAETAHRKLVDLAHEIKDAEGETRLFTLAASAHCEAHQLCSAIEGERRMTHPITMPQQVRPSGADRLAAQARRAWSR